MDLNQWEQKFHEILDAETSKFVDKNESTRDSPFKSQAQQKAQSKEELMKLLTLENSAEQIQRALILIRDILPQQVTKDEWEVIYEEFINCDEALISHFDAIENSEVEVNAYVSIAEMCGISSQTLMHCYELGQNLYAKQDYRDAYALFTFLSLISPETAEFWISSGLSCFQLKHFQEAMNLYQMALKLFPENIALYLHAANAAITDQDNTEAQLYLEQAKYLIDKNSKYQAEWLDIYEFLHSRLI